MRDAFLPWAVIAVIALLTWLIPLVWVLFSNRSEGGATFGWCIIVLVFSWLGFAVFLIITQKPKDSTRDFLRIEPGQDGRPPQRREN